MSEKAVHVIIEGRVQGVWFRGWTRDQASARGLAGWVRNRMDGRVEAVFAGPAEAVDAMVASCRDGPPAAHVGNVVVSDAEAPAEPGFRILHTG